MKIECEVCSATYTIDDAQLSDQPIGAQCPYCGHVRLVRRGDAGPPPLPSANRGYGFGAQDDAFGGGDLGGGYPGAAGPPFGGADPGLGHAPAPFSGGGNPFADGGEPPFGEHDPFAGIDLGAAEPPADPFAAQGAPAPDPFGGPPGGVAPPDPFGDGDPFGSQGATDPYAAGGVPGAFGHAGGAPPSDPYGSPADEGDPFSASLGTDGGYGASELDDPGLGEERGDAKCQVCGTPLSDEFDRVIGLCDVHQRERGSKDLERPEGAAAQPAAAGATSQGATWYARTRDGRGAGPMSLDDLRSLIRQQVFSGEDQFSRNGREYGTIHDFNEIAYLAASPQDTSLAPKKTFASAHRSRSLGRAVSLVLAAAILGVGGYLAYAQREQLRKVYQGLVSPEKQTEPMGPNPLKRYLANWRLAHPDVSGTASEHLVTARARFLEDAWSSYQQAEKAYERALLLDEGEPAAVAGYVENFAIWRYDAATPEERKMAEAAARFAEQLAPESSAPHRALAALALAKGDLNACRSSADAALGRNREDAEARLLLAGCYMVGNVPLTIEEAEKAKQILPALRRADRVLAEGYAKVGRFASALKVLDQRLEQDKDNAMVQVLYGNILRDLGDRARAEGHYKRALASPGEEILGCIALGELEIDEGDFAQAITYYSRGAKSEGLAGASAVRLYTGWAKAELLRGQSDRAEKLAEQALAQAPRDPAALLVRGQAALAKGDAETADVFARRTLDARNGEPAALVLAGNAAAALEKKDLAIKRFESAMANDSNDARVKGILAAMYLGLGGSPQAFTLMKRAAEVDPLEAGSRRTPGLLSLSELPVRHAIEQFKAAAAEERNASVALSAMGMMYYHIGDMNSASGALARALKADEGNVTALIYQAQLALDRRDAAGAKRAAEKLLLVERGSALGYLQLARAHRLRGDEKEARESYSSALRSNPGLLSAKVELAGLNLDTEGKAQAVEELRSAFTLNPHALNIRTLLYKAGI